MSSGWKAFDTFHPHFLRDDTEDRQRHKSDDPVQNHHHEFETEIEKPFDVPEGSDELRF